MIGRKPLSNHHFTETRGKKRALIALVSVLFIVGCLLLVVFWFNKTLGIQNSADTATKVFEIKQGQGLQEISRRLEEQKLIKNHFVLEVYLKYKGKSSNIQAGTYQIPSNLNIIQVSEIITSGKTVTNKITIPEGWTTVQIGDYLEKNKITTKSEFLEAIKKEYNYDFLGSKPHGLDLEGYLYPDTYVLSAKPDANEVIQKMLENFGNKLTPGMRAKAGTKKMSIHEVITLASIVEREAPKTEDRKKIAGIFENRLSLGMKLQSDVTVQYALNTDKKYISWEDTKVDSPYNTYVVDGLPVGPICNPSTDSIGAVLAPTESDFAYFLAAPDGTVYYSYTLDQHEAKKAKYLK